MVPRLICLFTALVLSLLLSGCTTTETVAGGGDDFPNSMQVLGARIVQNMGTEWDSPSGSLDLSEAASGAEQFAGSTPILPKRQSMQAVNADSIDLDITGKFVRYYERTDSTVVIDTTYFEINSTDTLIVKRVGLRVRTKPPLIEELYSITDLDGDGYLVNPASPVNQALVRQETRLLSNLEVIQTYSVITELAGDAGPDRLFETNDDNKVLYFSKLVTNKDGDTLEYADIRNSGGAFIIDNSSNDSTLVDVREIKSPLFKPSENRLQSDSRFVVFSKDSTRNYLISYSFSERKYGVLTYSDVKKISGEKYFYPGDTVRMQKIRVPLQSDSVVADTFLVDVKLGPDMAISSDDSCLAILVKSRKRLGTERMFSVQFTFISPVPQGAEPEDGDFSLLVESVGDEWQRLEGSIDASSISAHYTDSKGKIRDVVWDRDGRVVSQ